MSTNTSSDCGCDSDLGLPVGATGATGDPSVLNLSYSIGGAPFITTSTSYTEVGRFISNTTFAAAFTGIKNNVWMSAGTGSLRVMAYNTGNPAGILIYENTSITSTSVTNIETATGQTIYTSADFLITVEVKTQNIANSLSINCSTFYYTP
jgi:hypothetical protein